jgi:hypothetical protein
VSGTMTDVTDIGPDAESEIAPEDEGSPRPPTKVPGVWKQLPLAVKILLVALLLVAAGGIWSANRLTNQSAAVLGNGTIQQVIPNNNDKIPQQGEAGIRLATGYRATLAVNGTPVPQDQVDEIAAFNQFKFQPGSGKVLDAWPAGQNCVTATYFQAATGPSQSSVYTWCFTAF